MEKYRSTTFLCLLMFVLPLSWFLTGCRTTRKAAPLQEPLAQVIPSETRVESSTENLSMAKELRNRPVEEYVLGPEDSVNISVFRHDELSMEATISPTGKISYYFVRDVQAAGLTQFELRDKIQEELAKYIRDPSVVVRISEYRSHKVFVLGQVENPGVYYMRNDYTLLEAISAAGGISADAYLGGAYLVRDDEVLLVNFSQLIENGNMGENIPLSLNDVIYIPSNKDQKVFVLGEVNRQSAVSMGDGLFLFEAIAEAGGFTHDANAGTIVVLRGNLSKPQIMTIDAKDITFSANIPLEKGDIIFVDSSTFADVERTALRISNILKPFLQVMKGIILTDTAVDVLRGENVRRTITID